MSQATTEYVVYTPRDYHPDASDPVDRWLQTKFSANSLTTAYVVLDLFGRIPELIVDPFCGAGSAGLAARRLGSSFLGIELDPILAAVTLAKATLSAADIAEAKEYLPEYVSTDWLLANEIPGRVLALAMVAIGNSHERWRRRRTADLLAVLTEDLGPESPPAAAVVACGDSRLDGAWAGASAGLNTVLVTSPPFGPISANPWDGSAGDPQMRDLRRLVAERVFGAADAYSQALGASSGDPTTADLVSSVLAAGQRSCGEFLAIIEFEDGSADTRDLTAIVETLSDLPDFAVQDVLRTGTFSDDKTLYQIVAVSKARATDHA